jgi:hypothetical protein
MSDFRAWTVLDPARFRWLSGGQESGTVGIMACPQGHKRPIHSDQLTSAISLGVLHRCDDCPPGAWFPVVPGIVPTPPDAGS